MPKEPILFHAHKSIFNIAERVAITIKNCLRIVIEFCSCDCRAAPSFSKKCRIGDQTPANHELRKSLSRFPLNIFNREDIAVINKDSGLLSAPGKGPEKLDSASERLKKIFPGLPKSPFVHRLDMDTSGLLILAMNSDAHRTLSMDFEKRNVEKEYEALLVGKMENKEGIIDAPMRLDVDNRPYQIIDFERGKRAVTTYKLLDYEWKEGVLLSRVRFFPETGRTHQIRVHSSYIGHPILSDRLYGTYIEGVRLMLHASKITFTHPRTKKTMIISSEAPF